MKKIVSLLLLISPALVHACAGNSIPDLTLGIGRVLPEIFKNLIIWIAVIVFTISLFLIIGYTISYIFSRTKHKAKMIFIFLAILLISFFLGLAIYSSQNFLCASSQF
jgi:hypothetical protein